jgi:hypothetical protein
MSVPQGLLDSLMQGRCVLFAGPMLSSEAGLPTGDDLLIQMIEKLERMRSNDDWDALRVQYEAGQTALVGELLRRRLGPDGLRDLLREMLSGPGVQRSSTVFGALARAPFVGAITAQWDGLLSRAFEARKPISLTPRTSRSSSELLREDRFFLLKLYGDLRDADDLLFTVEDYREAIHEEGEFALLVTSILTARNLLFLGMSVGSVEEFCLSSGMRSPGERHWALVPHEAGFELQRERMLDRYGIELIPFDPQEPGNSIERFVGDLCAQIDRLDARRPVARERLRLESIELENIGPFERLEMEFPQDWMVLLGDNASGKSTILRAIALGLCAGTPGMALAPRRLLRSGASFGTIVLRLGGVVYRTEMRDEGRHVRVNFGQVAPVHSGIWLAIGFPPLRGMSTENPRGVVAGGKIGPSSDDLLPLLTGDVDLRLNDLKQWVFTTWLRANERAGYRAENYGRMLRAFFAMLQRLTPGVEFEFGGVDSETGEIQLSSPDGMITLDMLSQGMSSMLAWVGVLLERLYEVYEGDDEPQRRSALVLVDEIDAHLHPDWQRRLLPELQDMFPNLQMLATTHSPLIVGNTEPGEVVHLERHDGHLRQQPLMLSFRGMRADQILTSAAFDLDTTRDSFTDKILDEYRLLMRDPQLTPERRRRLDELRVQLRTTLPRPQETSHARSAASLLEDFARDRMYGRLADVSDEHRRELTEDARAYLTKLEGEGLE